jgi:hypothetical protein
MGLVHVLLIAQGSALLLEDVIFLILLALQRKRTLSVRDTTGPSLLLLPRYKAFMHVFIMQQIAQCAIYYWLYNRDSGGALLNVCLFTLQFLPHSCSTFIIVLTLQKGCGRNAFIWSLLIGISFSVLMSLIWALGNAWPFESFDSKTPWSQLNVVLTASIVVLYACIILVPDRLFYRRQACRIISIAFLLLNSLNLAMCATFTRPELTSTQTILFGMYLLGGVAAPVLVLLGWDIFQLIFGRNYLVNHMN